MREYECLYIINPQLTDEGVEAVSTRVQQVIQENGGEVLSINPWGKRRLAYEINRQREGYYIQMRVNGDTALPTALDQELRYAENVMRHLIVRADELDPAATDTIPEVLPEPSVEDFDSRHGRRGRYPREAAPQPPAPEAAAAAPAAAEAQAESPAEPAAEAAAEAVAEPVAEPAAEATSAAEPAEAPAEAPAEPAAEAAAPVEAPAEAAAEPAAEKPAAEEGAAPEAEPQA